MHACEVISEGSVEQNRDLKDRNRIINQSWPDELENDNKVHIHQGLLELIPSPLENRVFNNDIAK